MPQPIKFVACFAALATASIAQEPTARAQPKLDLSSYQIVYSSKRFSPPFNYAILFHELRARTSISRGLINSKDNCVSPYVSEDGKKIVYMIYTEGRNADIAIMSSEGKYARILTDNDDWDGFPALSRDGKRIIYTEKRQGVCRAIVMDTQGRYKRPVTPANYEVNCAIFSPDGKSIVFSGALADNDSHNYGQHKEYPFYGLYKMNLDGSGLKKLTSAGDRPAWSHDGKKIAFSNRGICVMNADGSAIRRLTWGDYVDNRASFAPDDKQLVFASTPFSRPGEKRIDIQSNAEKPQQIYVISLDGQRVEKLNLGRGEQGSPTLIKIPPFVSRFPRKGTH